MISRATVVLVALVALSSALDAHYEPSAAISDLSCYGSLHTHALWLPGVSSNLVFVSEPEPRLTYDSNTGTARMTGRVQDGNKIFDVDVTFSGFVAPDATAPSGSPKRELKSACYTGDVDTNTWSYFTEISGSLTAVPGSYYEGGIIDIGRFGPAMQVGIGANGKNTEFGFSAWLSRSVRHQPTNGNTISFSGSHGDFNINLAVVEEPECGCGPVTETLFSGQTIDTGSVTWNYDGEFLFLAEATNGWIMQTVHIHLGLEEPPTTGAGNPQIGHFNYHFDDIDTDYFTASIDAPEVTCGDVVYISFHAEMALLGDDGSVIQTETGFAEGPNTFDGNRWGWYSEYQTCCDYSDCDFQGCQLDSDCDNGGNICAIAECLHGNCMLKNNDAYQVATSCGVGACASTGVETCVDQELVDSCTEGPSSPEVCNGIDDNCDGQTDEGFVSETTTCGSDGCESSGQTYCDGTNGVQDTCDVNDSNGRVLAQTNCGLGICSASGEIVCSGGAPLPDSCEAGEPESEDDVCDGRDENCDGTVDEGFVSEATSCGSDGCESAGQTYCDGTNGVKDTCDVNDSNGRVLAQTNCGLGICSASGQIVCSGGAPLPDSCKAGEPESQRDVCDGRDENCNGVVDEHFVSEATSCGSDGCESAGQTYCDGTNGVQDTCDVNDSNGRVLAQTNCGLGICSASGEIVCSGGAPLPDSCKAGEPESQRDVCDGRDENCNGVVDEHFVAETTNCGSGECASQGVTSCAGVEGVQNSCDVHSTDNDSCNTDLCILNEVCTAGQCGGGSAKTCDDQNDCTVDSCDSTHGYCEHAALDSEECSGTIPIDVEVNCAANTTTICYEVFTNSSPSLSHWSVCVPDNVQVTGTGPSECPVITGIGRDGAIDFDGNVVKFDCIGEGGRNWSGTFCLTFQGVYDISEDGLAIVKRGQLEEYTQTIGIADCGDEAVQSDVCETSVTVEIDLTARKMARSVECTTSELRAELAELAGVSVFATTVYETFGDQVTVTFVDSASASAAEAAATLMEALNNGARPACLQSVGAVAVVDIPYYSSYEFNGFTGVSTDSANSDNSNSGASQRSEKSRSKSSDAASLGASLTLLFVALAALFF